MTSYVNHYGYAFSLNHDFALNITKLLSDIQAGYKELQLRCIKKQCNLI